MLRLQSVNQFYGPKHTLRDISLTLPRGECTCLLGRNGVGKTTLINCIMGHVPVTSGSMTWQLDGGLQENLLSHPVERRAALGIGYVPKGRQIFSQLSVDENLRVALMAGRNKTHQVPPMVYELFPQMYSMRQERAGNLTESQQQQLAIARALVLKPELLILDEPLSGFQPGAVQELSRNIRQMQHDFGLTLLLVEQQLSLVPKSGDRFCLLEAGRNVAQGSLDQLDDNLIQTYLAG
ncbi:ABC transporter ATP-binding protein [Biostraticola tofi]|uniref:Amino acid/amide ABC transporter ATP-binding protein 2 (HAAT family) n=1 Tax=Biostraticola tofi TaxID=466109 RepID=A0A4R3YZ41_9GAMM|nr:ATP-binding cassette domain-containing protein [Biostraticola tofi]TCV98051.1 amino acid/amide ABC transporter ATP-binding protein 2 (HAAT family) [Biostraticola tofi]